MKIFLPVIIRGSLGIRRQSLLIATGVLLASATVADACNVPVFRFALERWRPDPYRVVLFHRGALTEPDRERIRPLALHQEKSSANLVLRTINVAELEDARDREFFASQDNPQLPWLAVRYPGHLQIEAPVWKGTADANSVARLSDSPIRKELVNRLVDGQTAVWLFLESNQPENDEPAVALIESELKKLARDLELPTLTDSPDDALLSSTPLRIEFSVLRVPRGNVAEQLLIEMLLHSEPDLAERSDPLVFPVFGRGRALFPLVGAGITAENIREAAAFLVGPCSCQVKELNPGFDLLLAAEWDALLSQEGVAITAVASNQRVASGEPELVPIPSGSAPPQEKKDVASALDHSRRASESTAANIPAGVSLAKIAALSLLVVVGVIVAVQAVQRSGP